MSSSELHFCNLFCKLKFFALDINNIDQINVECGHSQVSSNYECQSIVGNNLKDVEEASREASISVEQQQEQYSTNQCDAHDENIVSTIVIDNQETAIQVRGSEHHDEELHPVAEDNLQVESVGLEMDIEEQETPINPNIPTQHEHPIQSVNESEDAILIDRSRAVGVTYEFAKPGIRENADEKRKRRRRNQRRISKEESRLREVIGDLPPPPIPGSSQHEDDCYLAIRAFEVEQMTYEFSFCEVCKERRLQFTGKVSDCCSRCRRDKQVPKLWSQENNMDPGLLPDELAGLTDAEQMLIARLAPAIHVRMLKHGGIASRGHCIAFPQAVQEPATILPRLPAEVDIIRVRRQGKNDTHKDFRVRRYRVQAALQWLRRHNTAYSSIVIDQTRIDSLPEDGELPQLRTVEFSETSREDDQGPAPEQLDVGAVHEDEETVSGVLLPEPGVDVQEQIQTAVNHLITEPEEDEGNHRDVRQRPVIPWPTTDRTPVSEFTTPYFFTMAFPCLFPTGRGDFSVNRPRTCDSLHNWAEHLLWYQDGRFAKHKVWKFVVHNMIMRKRALEQSRYFVDQQLGDPHITVADLQERFARGDTSIANKLLYFGASLRGTAQYWHQRRRELRAMVEFMVNEKKGLPSFFMTGSCAEFYFPPLRRLLEKYILETTGEVVDLLEDNNARFKAVQENTHLVVSYFDARTQSYHEKIVKGVFGVSEYWYRYEFAKSRGQIHWHQLSWRGDREPHELLNRAREDGCDEEELVSRLSDWVEEKFAMSASHPAGKDEDGNPKTEFWPPPEGTAEPLTDNVEDPLVKMLMHVSATQDAILEDHLQLVNRVALHSCSDYCLRTPRHPQPGLQPRERVCRMEFGSEFHRGKEPRDTAEIVTDRNGALRLELPRDHPRVVQHSRYQLQSWRANGDMSLIVSNSHPDDPSANEIIAVTDYVCGYACKENEPTGATIDLFKDMVNTTDAGDEVSGRSVCAKLLMKTVGRRDISGPEASFELSGLPLWHCSRQFTYLSMTGSRRLERNGDTATTSSSLDKYLGRPQDELCSWYEYACSNGKVPVVSGGATHATWPLNEDYCRTMLLLHWPSWFSLHEITGDDESWTECFEQFVESDECPTFVKAQVLKAQQAANYQRENRYEEDEEEEAVEEEEQPDWVEVYAGQNHCYEGVENEFQYDDGGEDFDWSSTSVQVANVQQAKEWLNDTIKVNEESSAIDSSVVLPDVSLSTLNEEQRSIVSLVLYTLYNYLEDADDYSPLRLVVSGTGGTGKSYVIKCLQRLVRQLFGKNEAIQVVTPTGNSAYLVQGRTAHSFFSLPTGGRSCSELSMPSGAVLERIQNRCENLKVLIGDERSMFGRTTMGWMEQHARYGMNRGNSCEDPWGGIPIIVLFGDEVQLPPVCDTPVYVPDSRSAPSNHGRLVWISFDSAVELIQNVRQNESEQQLRNVLMSMRTYTTSPDQVHWLQKFQWHNLLETHGEELLQRMDDQGLFVFPTHRLEWERNKSKLLECNQLPDHPVAKIKAVNNGKHAQKADSNKAGGLLQLIYLCRESKVMLVANIKVEWGLYNGAVGTVVDIIYLNGRRPTDDPPPHPDVVLVRFDGYKGPAFIEDHPTIVPIVPISRSVECVCRCKRLQIPLRLAWGMTIHKCQGMTVGEGETFRYIVVHPGNHAFESKSPGALFVALSRAKSAGGPGRDPDFAFHKDVLINEDRFRAVNTPTIRSRTAEIERLHNLAIECRSREGLAQTYDETTFHSLVNWAQGEVMN